MPKEKYNTILDIAMVILILSSLFLMYLGYQEFYAKPLSKKQKKEFVAISPQKDSLQKQYTATTLVLSNALLMDSLQKLDTVDKAKLTDVETLKSEIALLLNTKNNEADMALAKLKIEDLQIKVAALQYKYSGVAAENTRLQILLDQIVQNTKSNNNINTNKQDNTNNKFVTTSKKINSIALRQSETSALAIAAIQQVTALVNVNNAWQETNVADATEKLTISFTCKLPMVTLNEEVIVVIFAPNGKIVKNSEWETGTFDTPQGKKLYTKKFIVEKSTEEKKLSFTLTQAEFYEGIYSIQIWNNGVLLAKNYKSLI